ncbi:MAG TPA: retropepsin-like aspartic protease, partial [Rhizomicrobium sp.]
MYKLALSLACALFAAAPALAATPVEILAANKAASGGAAWDSRLTLKTEYAYAGQGMTGWTRSTNDLKQGRWVDEYQIGPLSGGNGFDGTVAWEREPSGTVTAQEGGEQRALAMNEGYRRANLWWRPDFGGADVAAAPEITDNGATYDPLTVAPKGGKPFTAWFDAKSHLLARIVEKQAALTVTTSLSDYHAVEGTQIPGKLLIDDGRGAKYIQILTFSKAEFGPALDASVFAKPNVRVADFFIAGGAEQTTLPIKIINNHIYGYAKVNGKGPYLFIFDTGGANLVTPATAKALGLKVEGQAPGGGAGEGTVDVGFAKVASVQVGGATIKSQVFPVVNFIAPGVEGVDETGMIGFETFRRFITRIDYAGGKLTLMKAAAFNPKEAGTPVPFVFHESIPEVQGSFEGIPTKFDIDTGSRSELTLTKPFAEKKGLRAKHPRGVDAVGGWGVGGPSRAYFTRGASMTLGTVKIDNVVTG